jgi:hypothetical protein
MIHDILPIIFFFKLKNNENPFNFSKYYENLKAHDDFHSLHIALTH